MPRRAPPDSASPRRPRTRARPPPRHVAPAGRATFEPTEAVRRPSPFPTRSPPSWPRSAMACWSISATGCASRSTFAATADDRGRGRSGRAGQDGGRRDRRARGGRARDRPSTVDAVLGAMDQGEDVREVFEDVVWPHRGSGCSKTVMRKRYVDAIRGHTVTFGVGPAGTGKTYLAWPLPSPRCRSGR